MKDENNWEDIVKGIKKLKTNRYVEDIKPKEIELRKDKVTTVTFEAMKGGHCVEKDDFSQMDGCLAKKFKRELFKIEDTLDLHGITEKVAYDTVCEFVKFAYNTGKRCILIVTGKGIDDAVFSEKGVLRKSVPNWLAHSEISPLILAYKNPSERLGGTGALYILLRKKISR